MLALISNIHTGMHIHNHIHIDMICVYDIYIYCIYIYISYRERYVDIKSCACKIIYTPEGSTASLFADGPDQVPNIGSNH